MSKRDMRWKRDVEAELRWDPTNSPLVAIVRARLQDPLFVAAHRREFHRLLTVGQATRKVGPTE